MFDIKDIHALLSYARAKAGLTQHALADRLGTSQSTIARLERGEGNPTLETISRFLTATGVTLRCDLTPIPTSDPTVDAYKSGVDRTLLRANLQRSVEERLRMNEEARALGTALATGVRRRLSRDIPHEP